MNMSSNAPHVNLNCTNKVLAKHLRSQSVTHPRNRYETKTTIDKHFDVRANQSNTPKIIKSKVSQFKALDRQQMRNVAYGFNRPKQGRSEIASHSLHNVIKQRMLKTMTSHLAQISSQDSKQARVVNTADAETDCTGLSLMKDQIIAAFEPPESKKALDEVKSESTLVGQDV